jgi:hypothetical protein
MWPLRFRWLGRAGDDAHAELWIAIVQKADSSTLFDDLDAALQNGSPEKTHGHAAVCLRRFERLKLKIDFDKLSKPNAKRLLRLWQVGEVSARSA